MKKIIITLLFASAASTMSAQTETKKNTTAGFNKWSIELAGGLLKAQRPLTPGYQTATPSPFVVDLGARYMFNNKFGLKADFGYNSFQERKNSPSFDSKYYRVDLQAVANLGRIMSFETWTNTLGLLAHTGFGVAALDNSNFSKNDKIANFLAGVTAQVKLSDRFVLTGDVTTMINALQDRSFDGASAASSRGFSGILFNSTIGLTYYLGKNAKHADWTLDNQDEIKDLQQRVSALESKIQDADNDGVADYLDTEANTPAGTMVNTKGKAIDKNNNGVPDDVENYIEKNKASNTATTTDNELIKNLINGGYVCTYFDFNKSTPTNVSTDGIDFILTYLRNNPSASVDIIGHADEVGRSAYNDKLANARANNVKNILVKAKIEASRLNVISAGEDKSVENVEGARKLVRRVTFRVK